MAADRLIATGGIDAGGSITALAISLRPVPKAATSACTIGSILAFSQEVG
jgi:hypothetical protein